MLNTVTGCRPDVYEQPPNTNGWIPKMMVWKKVAPALNMAIFDINMGVSKNRGTPKWMVKIRENAIKMDDLGGNTPIFGLTPIG